MISLDTLIMSGNVLETDNQAFWLVLLHHPGHYYFYMYMYHWWFELIWATKWKFAEISWHVEPFWSLLSYVSISFIYSIICKNYYCLTYLYNEGIIHLAVLEPPLYIDLQLREFDIDFWITFDYKINNRLTFLQIN